MKNFPKFSSGDPISASRMNDLVDYAGVASSDVPNVPGTYFGSPNANATTEYNGPTIILVFATEDFAINTTDHTSADDCPSGLCNFVDLIRSTNTYDPQITGRDFYVHDPAAAENGGAKKSLNDVFYAVWNKNSKRWEALPKNGDRLQVILQEDLFAAVDTLTDPSTASAKILRRSSVSNSDDVITLVMSDDLVTVVNRFENISIDSGTYMKVEWIDGEWQPYAADCPGGSSSSGSM